MFKDMSKIKMWYIWMVTNLRRNVTIVHGASYHLLGSWISQDLKIRFWLQVESYISDWRFSESWHLASYVSRHNAMAYDRGWRATKWAMATAAIAMAMATGVAGEWQQRGWLRWQRQQQQWWQQGSRVTKRARARMARAMVMAMRVAGIEGGKGDKAMAAATRVTGKRMLVATTTKRAMGMAIRGCGHGRGWWQGQGRGQ